MKNFKRILALVLSVLMVMSVAFVVSAGAEDAVTATKTTYNAQSINRLNKLGIFKGSTSGDMHADDNVTREQMALFVGRVITGKTATNYWENYENDTTFKDIDKESAEYVGAVAYAFETGIVVGKSAERFDPKGNVSYQDALTMAVRSLGYTGLSYPNGYINKAIKLGLTTGIDGVAYKDAAVRGVIATILYNALYSEDSVFAKNFNLTSGVYMLVATPAITTGTGTILPAATIGGYTGKTINAGYVAFAPIEANGRPSQKTYVYAQTAQVSDDITTSFADRLGYGYKLTFENEVLTWCDECATKTFVNFGDDREITSNYIKYKNGTAIVEGDFLTLGDVKYTLAETKEADFTAVTGTKNIILYNIGSDDVTVNEYSYLYDANGNIVDNAGNILLYKKDGKFYVKNGTAYTEATDEQVHNAQSVVASTTKSGYGILPQDNALVKSIADNYFCEVTAMDYNGDGNYDAAIYNTYRVGFASFDRNNKNMFKMTGEGDLAFNTWNNSQSIAERYVDIRDYTFVNASTLANYGTYVYKYNRLNNEITVVKKGLNSNGMVTWATKGAVDVASNTYKNSKVKLGTTEYKVGGFTEANIAGLKAFCKVDAYRIGNAGLSGRFTNTFENGWNDLLYESMDATKYDNFIGFAVAGHLVCGCPVLKANTYNYNFVAFDPWVSTFAVNNDMIVVKALTDATGEYHDVTIKSVEGEEFTNIEYDAFCDYIDVVYAQNANIIKYSYFFNETLKANIEKTELFKTIFRKNVIEQLYATIDAAGNFATSGLATKGTMYYGVKDKNTDGSFNLTVVKPADMYVTAVNTNTITFKFGISSVALSTNDGRNADQVKKTAIATTDKTVFTFVCADGIYTYVGQPKDTYSLNLNGVALYCANENQIMVIAQDKNVADVAIGDVSWTSEAKDIDNVKFTRTHNNTWAFKEYVPYIPKAFKYDDVYMVTAKTAMVEAYKDTEGDTLYFYTGLYNLVTGKYEDSVESKVELPVTVDVATKYGTLICRNTADKEKVVDCYELAQYKDVANDSIFNMTDADVKFTFGKYESFDKDNTGAIAHVTIGTTKYTVKSVSMIVSYFTNSDATKVNGAGLREIEVGDFTKIAKGASVYYTYNEKTGELTGYAFNK